MLHPIQLLDNKPLSQMALAPHSPTLIMSSSDLQAQRQSQVFEFTKRKKWADILLSELPDTVLLVLDSDGEIQYVGPNTTEVLGWEVEDLSEKDVLDFINDVDKATFNNHLRNSLSSRQDLSCYARMKCKPLGKSIHEQGPSQKELLFEIRGHPLYLPDDNECKCFFLVAKPYPSRNMAVLNTFLELKIENERLTQRLKDLKSQQDVTPGAIGGTHLPNSPTTMSHPRFATFEFPSAQDGTMQSPSTASTTGSFSAIQTAFINSAGPGTNTTRDEEGEEGGKKRKKKGNGQQYVCVTCGRTDSPEWRKGPRGPKTLCNACGLRWAKRSKRTDDVPIPYVQGQQQGSREGEGMVTSASGGGSSRNTRGAPVPNAALSVTPPVTGEKYPVVSSSPGPAYQGQGQSRQGHGNYAQVPAPSPISPTHSAFPHPHPHSQPQHHSQSQSSAQSQPHQTQMAFSPTLAGAGHYAHPGSVISAPLHQHQQHQQQQQQYQQQQQQQGMNMNVTVQQAGLSPTTVHPHPHSHAHGYMHATQTQTQSQQQSQQQSQPQPQPQHGQEHYHQPPVYDQLRWSMGQAGEGSYQY